MWIYTKSHSRNIKTVNTYFVEKYLNVRGREYEETHQSMFTPTQPHMKIPSGETPHHMRKIMLIKTDFVIILEKHRFSVIFTFIKLIYYQHYQWTGKILSSYFHSHSITAAAPVTDHPLFITVCRIAAAERRLGGVQHPALGVQGAPQPHDVPRRHLALPHQLLYERHPHVFNDIMNSSDLRCKMKTSPLAAVILRTFSVTDIKIRLVSSSSWAVLVRNME